MSDQDRISPSNISINNQEDKWKISLKGMLVDIISILGTNVIKIVWQPARKMTQRSLECRSACSSRDSGRGKSRKESNTHYDTAHVLALYESY